MALLKKVMQTEIVAYASAAPCGGTQRCDGVLQLRALAAACGHGPPWSPGMTRSPSQASPSQLCRLLQLLIATGGCVTPERFNRRYWHALSPL